MPLVCGFDTETTGLDWNDGHRIIEVAMVFRDFETRESKGRFAQRIHPERSIQAKAQAVHGIALEDLTGCPTWEVIAPKIAVLIGKADLVVAHNGDSFDFPFLAHELDRVGLKVPDVEGFDTMADSRWATPFGKSPALGELCFALDVPYDPSKAHGALYDVDVLLECFFRGVDIGRFKPEFKTKEIAA